MAHYLVDSNTNIILSKIIVGDDWTPPSGTFVIESDVIANKGWVYTGQGIDPPSEEDVIVTVPSVSPRQIRLALNHLGLRSNVEAYVANSSQDIQDSWQYAISFVPSDPFVEAARIELNKTQDEMNAVFIYAATL